MATYFKAIRPDGASFHDPSFMWATEVGGVTYHPTHGKSGNTSTAAGYLSVSTTATDCTGMRWPCRLLEVEPVGDLWTPDAADLPNKRAGLSFRTVRELPATGALGPQGVHLVALIERCAGLADDDARKLRAARDAARDAAWDAAGAARAARDAARDAARVRGAARDAALDAAGDAVWGGVWGGVRGAVRGAAREGAGDGAGDGAGAAWDAALDAALDAVGDAAWDAALDAAQGAAWALVVRDLIGDTFTQAHYDTLTMPWRTVIGPIHPDDAVVGA